MIMVMGTVYTFNFLPEGGKLVEVQVRLLSSIPAVRVLGRVSKEVRESGVRVLTAFKSVRVTVPIKKIIINLLPTGLRKEGSHYDLAIAAAIYAQVKKINSQKIMWMGEVGLDGQVFPLDKKQLFTCLSLAKKEGIEYLVLPKANYPDVKLDFSLKYYWITNIAEINNLAQTNQWKVDRFRKYITSSRLKTTGCDRRGGEDRLPVWWARLVSIVCAGGLRTFFLGGADSGKSLWLNYIIKNLPILNETEDFRIQQHGVDIAIKDKNRPVYYLSSKLGLAELEQELKKTIYHLLVIRDWLEFPNSFLDKFLEEINPQKAKIDQLFKTMEYYFLIGLADQCLCGNLGKNDKECLCTSQVITRVQIKLSPSYMHRFDLVIKLNGIKRKKERKVKVSFRKINKAFRQVVKRFGKPAAYLDYADCQRLKISTKSLELLNKINTKHNLSLAMEAKLLKIAYVISLLDEKTQIGEDCLIEAWQLIKIN